MDKKIYKSSTFDRVLFSLTAFGILVPGLWIILYGISKHSYDWPLAAAGILLCSYTIYILQKFFTYKVVLQEDRVEIHKLDNVQSIMYEDIVNLYQKGRAFYIIDRIMKNGEYYLRGTANLKYSGNEDKVSINLLRLPVIQSSYIENYEDAVKVITERSGAELEIKRSSSDRKSLFASLFFLKSVDYRHLKQIDIFKMFLPYIIIGLTFLLTLVEFWVLGKGNYPQGMDSFAKYAIPLLSVIGLNILVLNFIHYLKKLFDSRTKLFDISKLHILLFILFNICLTMGVFTIFLIVINKAGLE